VRPMHTDFTTEAQRHKDEEEIVSPGLPTENSEEPEIIAGSLVIEGESGPAKHMLHSLGEISSERYVPDSGRCRPIQEQSPVGIWQMPAVLRRPFRHRLCLLAASLPGPPASLGAGGWHRCLD